MGKDLEGADRVGHANGIDWLIGRELPSMVSKLGPGQPQAKTDVQNIRGRDRGTLYFQLFFAEVRDRVVGSGQLDAATLKQRPALLKDPNYWTQCWMMTAVWVRRRQSECHSPGRGNHVSVICRTKPEVRRFLRRKGSKGRMGTTAAICNVFEQTSWKAD